MLMLQLRRLAAAALYFLPLLALLGSLAYLAFGLAWPVRFIVLFLSLISSVLLEVFFPLGLKTGTEEKTRPWTMIDWLILSAYAVSFIVGLYLLWQGRSDRPLISPWDTVSNFEFLAFGLGSLCLLILARRRLIPRLCLVAHYLWAFSIFLFVYAIGYGFDPFIHEAAVKAIEASGRIQPLTPYYLGQYSVVAIFHSIIGGTIAGWSRWLVPVLAGISLPCLWPRRSSALLLLLFPFTILTLTTPQNLAYLFLLLIICLAMQPRPAAGNMLLVWLLAGAAFLTQPIAGLPALILATTLAVENQRGRLKRSWRWLSLLAFALSVPAALYAFSWNSPTALNWHWPDLVALFQSLVPGNPSRESWWLNATYLWDANRGWLYLLLAAGGFWLARRQAPQRLTRFAWPALALLISAIVASALDFHFLIEYERSDYPLRLLLIAGLFCVPLAALPLEHFFARLAAIRLRRTWPLYLLLAALLSASLYLSYPRYDHYHDSHGYAVSKADTLAVDWIERDAAGGDYVVLANQQASAAALRQLGFKKYYPNDIFFYPIPTGGPLYRQYLAMIKRPDRETMRAAMDLAGVDRAYFLLDSYWRDADKIAAEAELIADRSEAIAGGQVRVYRFTK